MKVKNIIYGLIILVFSNITTCYITKKKIMKMIHNVEEQNNKHLSLYLMMNRWVYLKQKNISIAKYLKDNNYHNIAIYGMNYVGETLYNELEETDIDVKYAIDQNADSIFGKCEVIVPEDEIRPVDAIIVTPIYYYDEIEKKLKMKTNIPILSIEDIIYELV